jgi:hypothetical protein
MDKNSIQRLEEISAVYILMFLKWFGNKTVPGNKWGLQSPCATNIPDWQGGVLVPYDTLVQHEYY